MLTGEKEHSSPRTIEKYDQVEPVQTHEQEGIELKEMKPKPIKIKPMKEWIENREEKNVKEPVEWLRVIRESRIDDPGLINEQDPIMSPKDSKVLLKSAKFKFDDVKESCELRTSKTSKEIRTDESIPTTEQDPNEVNQKVKITRDQSDMKETKVLMQTREVKDQFEDLTLTNETDGEVRDPKLHKQWKTKQPKEPNENKELRQMREIRYEEPTGNFEVEPNLTLDPKEVRPKIVKVKQIKESSETREIKDGRQMRDEANPNEQDHKEGKDLKETKVSKQPKIKQPKEMKQGNAEIKATKEFKKPKEHKVSKEIREIKEVKDCKEPKEAKEPKESKDPKELKEPKDSKDPKDLKELKDPRESKELKEPKDLREQKELKEIKELKELTKDPRETKELKEQKDGREQKEPKDLRDKDLRDGKDLNSTPTKDPRDKESMDGRDLNPTSKDWRETKREYREQKEWRLPKDSRDLFDPSENKEVRDMNEKKKKKKKKKKYSALIPLLPLVSTRSFALYFILVSFVCFSSPVSFVTETLSPSLLLPSLVIPKDKFFTSIELASNDPGTTELSPNRSSNQF
eukprot:TRINITY_DN2968_c0_g1_i2.p1 TRINITY_DN2968_c0_g1~~TRINITY_DN2968_c0_g1_i2.p1  ORF type:complete len:574 (+),score=149.98 TRINITY_DN2968_c0_g1_i2:603-2324(+)